MDKTIEQIKRAHQGDKTAREALVKDNLGLVWSIVRRFAGRGCETEDLFQIGSIGLLKAIDKFDPSFEVCFSTYAVPMILGEVKRYLRDNNSIRVSRSLRDTAYKAIYTRENLLKKQSKEPTLCEIAKELGVSKEEIAYALDAIQSPVSLYEPVYTDGGDPLYVMDQLSDKKNSEEHWVEDLSLVGRRCSACRTGNAALLICAFLRERPRQRLPKKSIFRRRRCHGWRRVR